MILVTEKIAATQVAGRDEKLSFFNYFKWDHKLTQTCELVAQVNSDDKLNQQGTHNLGHKTERLSTYGT